MWECGGATVRELADALYPGGASSGLGTVQKLLQRLEALVDRLCAGSWMPVLTQLARRRRLTDDERAELRRFVDELEKAPRRRRRRK